MSKELEQSIRELALTGDPKKELEISKLVAFRNKELEERRRAKKAEWMAKSRKEVVQLSKFQRSGVSQRFPEEVWRVIFSHMEDPKEKARLSNLSPMWRDAMKLERTTFLFHQVFPVLYDRGHLTLQDVLNIRTTISPEWDASIENHLQNKFDLKSPSSTRYYLAELPTMDLHFPLCNFNTVISVGNMDLPPNGNPFFTRKVFLEHRWHDNTDGRVFLTLSDDPPFAKYLLGQYGREVWAFTVQLFNPKLVNVYSIVQELLPLMPNLKELIIKCDEEKDDTEDDTLKTLLKERPLPELPHLKYMYLDSIPPGIRQTMLNKYQSSLESLVIYTEELIGNEFDDIRFPDLKRFLVETERLWIPGVQLNLNWPSIEEITLNVTIDDASVISKLFRGFNQVGGTLRKLKVKLRLATLDIPLGMEFAQVNTPWLELHHLEEFSLKCPTLSNTDFILPITSLRKLTITCVNYAEKESAKSPAMKEGREHGKAGPSTRSNADMSGEIINFNSDTFHESNIWSLFPQLEWVSLSNVVLWSSGRSKSSLVCVNYEKT